MTSRATFTPTPVASPAATTSPVTPVTSTTPTASVAAIAAPPEYLLVRHIRAHIDKGDKAKKKAEDHYIAAGQYLATLKAAYAPTWAAWEDLLKTKVKLSTGRASELMQLAGGRKTVAQIRAGTNRRQIRYRLRYNEEESPEASAEAMKARFADADAEQGDEVEAGEVEDDLETLGKTLGTKPDPNPDTDSTRSRPSRPVVAGTPITARGLVRILADCSAEVRQEAVAALTTGTCQSDFAAVVAAVGDLYQQLSKAGR